MNTQGAKLLEELKNHVIKTMINMPECDIDGQGCSYRTIQDEAGLALGLSAQDGWLTWSVLAALAEERRVETLRKGRRLFWKMCKT